MKTVINRTHIEGWLYDHKLQARVTGENSKAPGTPFITGTVSIATDNDITNIVDVHFTYVTATTAKGSPNGNFNILKNIIDGKYGMVMTVGKDNAVKVRCDSAIGLNDFYVNRDGVETLVSAKRNEGGFIHTSDSIADDEKTRNTFECDMIITSVKRVEGDPERGTSDKVIVKGATFDFRKSLLPVEFSAVNPNAMDYFENLGATNKEPVFTKVWGRQISAVTTRKIEEESAFGEVRVREVQSNHKDWVITGAAREPYLWDDESSITIAELSKAMTDRDVYLATVKQRRDEYLASQGKSTATNTTEFKF